MGADSGQTVLRAESLEAVQEHITAAVAQGEPLEVLAGGSKRSFGRAVRAPRVLDVSALSGIVDYQPHELLLVARPGTPLAEVERTLADQGQHMAFEPPGWDGAATLGGVLAANLSGPRRFKAGAARDHLLGFQAVTGRGEVVRGGGKVVKNVTGYDLSKLMCGSFGTLGVMTEVVVKVLPAGEAQCTVLLPGLSDGEGIARLVAASRSSHEPSGLAHLPAGSVLEGAAVAAAGGGAVTAIRVEGPNVSVRARSEALVADAGVPGAEILADEDSTALWRAVRELSVLPADAECALWRFSVAPTDGPELGARLRSAGARALAYDWGGAQLWASLPEAGATSDPHALAGAAGGHAMRVRTAPASGTDGHGDGDTPFGTLGPGVQRLNLNLKLAFDPARVLNPGRMYPDI